MHQSPRPCWNLVSLIAPFLGMVCAIAVYCLGDYFLHEHPAHFLKHGAMTLGVFLVLGFASAFIALARSERLWGLTALGFALNAPFAIIAVAAPWDWPF